VLVRGDKIEAVGPKAQITAPADATTITLAGTTLLLVSSRDIRTSFCIHITRRRGTTRCFTSPRHSGSRER
jgi:hypothetical protein